MFVLATASAFREYHAKRREIRDLKRYGADHAEIAYLQRSLRAWVCALPSEGRGGQWFIPTLTDVPFIR